MRIDIIYNLCILIFSASAVSLKCYMCSIQMPATTFMNIPCKTPTQVHCKDFSDMCVSLVLDRSMYYGCMNPTEDNFIRRSCEMARNISKRNCRTCITDLCNSAKVGSNISVTWGLMLVLATALFIRIMV